MTDWLAGVRDALDAASAPVTFFVRDDDVGWADDELLALLTIFADFNVPIDLAVIPLALTPQLAACIQHREQRVEIHQHGFAHANHEPTGRKCEFGPSRLVSQQHADIAAGWQRLAAIFDMPLQRIFTPPWNRCTVGTAECVRDLGFVALSRDASAGLFGLNALSELPITYDWFAQRKGVALDRLQRGALLAEQVATSPYVGIMLHHARMDAIERADLIELLRLLCGHPSARISTMAEMLQTAT